MNKPTYLKKKEVLDWFGDKERYIKFHDEQSEDVRTNFGLDDD